MCPYCSNETFVGATTHLRSYRTDESGRVTAKVWANECKRCGRWSAHVEAERAQRALVDDGDPASDIAAG